GGDGDVDEEDRAPGDVLGQPAADQRAEREGDGRDAGPRADGAAALLGRERVGDDAERGGAEQGGAGALGGGAREPGARRGGWGGEPGGGARPVGAQEPRKTRTPIRKPWGRQKMSPRRPPVTSRTANESEYALMVHSSADRDASKLRWMLGSATFVTVLSSMT